MPLAVLDLEKDGCKFCYIRKIRKSCLKQENSVKMGQLLAVHNEKLDKQDRIDAVLFEKVDSVHREVTRKTDEIKKGCERDIRKVDDRLRQMEKKMWSIFGALTVVSFLVSAPGQSIIRGLTNPQKTGTLPSADRLEWISLTTNTSDSSAVG